MAYVPNPIDITQPTGSVDASTAAAEFRALKEYIASLTGLPVTWNPSDKSALLTLSGGNLVTTPAATLSATAFASVRGTIGKNSGKWYYEVTASGAAGASVGLGTTQTNLETAAGVEVYSIGLLTGTGEVIYNGAVVHTFPDPLFPGETAGVGYDLATGDITFSVPSGIQTVNVPAFAGATLYPLISVTYLTTAITANFGATSFSGFIFDGYFGLYTPTYNYNENANLIINGGCLIDQQNAGAAVNPVVNNTYVIDGWRYFGDVAAKFRAGQNLNAVTPAPGYSKYLGVEVILAYTPAAAEAFWLEQRIEGYSTVALAFSTTSATPMTLLFSVRSSLTGVHSGVITDGTNTRVYPFEFTITAANSWQKQAILIQGDVNGTWNALTNSINMKARFCLGAVASRKPASGIGWQADAVNSVGSTNGINIVSTLAATFYVTGVELRRGLYLTNQPRELVAVKDVFAECYRYFYRTEAITFVAGNAAGVGATAINHVSFPVPMRAAPAVSTTFAAAVNCTGSVNNVGPAGVDLGTIALAAGTMTISYSVGNTFDARL